MEVTFFVLKAIQAGYCFSKLYYYFYRNVFIKYMCYCIMTSMHERRSKHNRHQILEYNARHPQLSVCGTTSKQSTSVFHNINILNCLVGPGRRSWNCRKDFGFTPIAPLQPERKLLRRLRLKLWMCSIL